MTDRPIIFSGPMIRALIEGRKTQTRRVLKPKGHASLFSGEWSDNYVLCDENSAWRNQDIRYALGDRLWVRETWAKTSICPIVETIDNPWFVYRECDNRCDYGGPWKPSIFMPRAASRLTLTVTDVRVQRLQDISNKDARAEGATGKPRSSGYRNAYSGWSMDWPDAEPAEGWRWVSLDSPRLAFASFWNDINGTDAWDANPWVVALTFDVHQQNIDHMRDAA